MHRLASTPARFAMQQKRSDRGLPCIYPKQQPTETGTEDGSPDVAGHRKTPPIGGRSRHMRNKTRLCHVSTH